MSTRRHRRQRMQVVHRMQELRRGQGKVAIDERTTTALMPHAYGYLLDQRRRRALIVPTVLACLCAVLVVAGLLSRPAISATAPGAVGAEQQANADPPASPDEVFEADNPQVDEVTIEEPATGEPTEDTVCEAAAAPAEAPAEEPAQDEPQAEDLATEEAADELLSAAATGEVYYGVDTRQLGMVINLFDYSGDGKNNADDVLEGSTSRGGSPILQGINNPTGAADSSFDLSSVLYFSRHTTFDENKEFISSRHYRDINQGAIVNQGIVYDRLIDGIYPSLSTTNPAVPGGSLSYLFNPSEDDLTRDGFKTVYQGATGLFTYDDKGYLVYNSDATYARLDPNGSGIFTLYDTYEDTTSTPARTRMIGFFPFDDPVFDGTDTYTNKDHFFGMTMEAAFIVPPEGMVNGEPMVFEFTGDDDMWVFIDGVLMLDMGGIHAKRAGSINFATGEIKTDTANHATDAAGNFLGNAINLPDGSEGSTATAANLFTRYGTFWNTGQPGDLGAWQSNYSLHHIKVFYLERGSGESNLKITTNLVFPYTDITARKTWSDGAENHNSDSVTVGLFYQDGDRLVPVKQGETHLTQVLNKNNNWTYVFENVPSAELANSYNVPATPYQFVVKELSYTTGGTTYELYKVGSDGYGQEVAAQGPYVASEAMFGDSMAGTLTGVITNTAIRKVDDDGRPLQGAHLYLHAAIYDSSTGAVSWNTPYLQDITTDANGYLQMPALAPGDYVLWEFNGPDGYSRSRPESDRVAWHVHVEKTEAANPADSTVALTVTTLKNAVIGEPTDTTKDSFGAGSGERDADDSYFLTSSGGTFSLINRMRPKLLVNKVDAIGQPINGITFRLTPLDANFNPVTDDPNRQVSTRITGSDNKDDSGFDDGKDSYELTGEDDNKAKVVVARAGSVRFLDVYEGYYLLEEVSASGYALSGPWRVRVKNGRVANVYAQNAAGEWVHPNDESITGAHTYIRTTSTHKGSGDNTVYYGSVIYLRNYENEVSIQKTAANGSAAGTALAGVTFALYTVGDDPQPVNDIHGAALQATTDANGIATFKGIPTSTETTCYYLYETVAATGYRLPEEPWLLEIEADGTTRLTDQAGRTAVSTDASGNYLISNYVNYELPKAGGIGAGPVRAAGAALVATALLGLHYHRRRRQQRTGWSPPGCP